MLISESKLRSAIREELKKSLLIESPALLLLAPGVTLTAAEVSASIGVTLFVAHMWLQTQEDYSGPQLETPEDVAEEYQTSVDRVLSSEGGYTGRGLSDPHGGFDPSQAGGASPGTMLPSKGGRPQRGSPGWREYEAAIREKEMLIMRARDELSDTELVVGPESGQRTSTKKDEDDTESDTYFRIKQHGSSRVAVQLVKSDMEGGQKEEVLAEVLIGPPLMTKGQSRTGPCDGAWKVMLSYTHTRGYGPILYDIAIEVASELASGLMSDDVTVSDKAKVIWDKYLANRSLATSPTPLRITDLDDAYTKFITPGNSSDDCNRRPARAHYPGGPNTYWADGPEDFDSNLPDDEMMSYGDPPAWTVKPDSFTSDFEEFYRSTGITKKFYVDGHPTVDRLKRKRKIMINHSGLQHWWLD